MRKQLLLSLGVFLFIITGTALVIIYGQGYRLGTDISGKPGIIGTGLLVVKSNPDGAEVYVNEIHETTEHLTTATNNTINLAPGTYKVKIYKDGYFPWQKTIKIEKEIVSKADAFLIPKAPKLENITLTGVNHAVIDPSFTKIAYTVASEAAKKKNGIYVLDMSGRSLLSLQGGSRQLVDNDNIDTFSDADLLWEPTSENLIATISANRSNPSIYLLNPSESSQTPKDITETLDSIQQQWAKEKEAKDKAQFDSLRPSLQKVAKDNFNIIAWSPDESHILYQASQSASIPRILKPPLIGTNSTPENRDIEKDNVYIYDIKEDRNYLLSTSDKKIGIDYQLTWFPDSNHLIYVHDHRIDIMEYDGQNSTTIYAGPFEENFVYSWPDGSKIVILTNLNNPDIPLHLYTIGLR